NGQQSQSTVPVTTPDQAASPGVISPLVRKLARDAGLDLRQVRGSGPNGIVRRADVTAATAPPQDVGEQSEDESAAPAGSAGLHEDAAGDRRIPMRGLRKSMADKMAASRREIPEATVWVDADATELVRVRRELNE